MPDCGAIALRAEQCAVPVQNKLAEKCPRYCAERQVSIFVMVDSDFSALEQQPIPFTGKVFAPQAFFSAHDEIGVLATLRPREWRRRVELDPFSAKSDLSGFEHDPKDYVAERSREQRANARCDSRIRLHQSWNNHAASHACDRSADCHPIGNNEMLEIDE